MIRSKEDDPNFKKILNLLLNDKGFDGQQYKFNYMKRRISVRMRATASSGYHEYLNVLQTDRNEINLLLDRLTIHVTEFFRDPSVFAAIKERLLGEFKQQPFQKIKIWCAGCSTGEEAYSVGILFKELAFSYPGLEFEIFATDIDINSIRTADRGEYPIESLRKVPPGIALRWFHQEGKSIRVISQLKKEVKFRVHDLLGSWPVELSDINIIFCRNLLIYLMASQQQKIYERFAKSLLPGGILVLGLTETLLGKARKYYQCLDVKHRIYQTLENIPVSFEPTQGEG